MGIAVGGAAQQPTTSEIVGSYLDSFKRFERVSYRAEAESVMEGTLPGLPLGRRGVRTITYRRDGERLDTAYEETTFRNPDDETGIVTRSREVHDEGLAARYNTTFNKKGAYTASSVTTDIAGRKSKTTGMLLSGACLDGFFNYDEGVHISEVLARSEGMILRDEMETVDDHATYVVEASTPHGTYVLWLDPEYGYQPRRVLISKTGDDLMGGVAVNERTAPSVAEGPPPALERYTLTVDRIEIERISGIPVATGARIVAHSVFADGTDMRIKSTFHRSEVDFDPDFTDTDAFQLDAPEGARVYHKDFPGIRYVWRRGEMVPVADPQTIDQIEETIAQLGRDQPALKASPARGAPRAESGDLFPAQEEPATGPSLSIGIIATLLAIGVAVSLLFIALRSRGRKPGAPS